MDNILSCGNDGLLLKFDVRRNQTTNACSASDVHVAHEEACLRLSPHPSNPNMVLTAGQDYLLKLWDLRQNTHVGQIQRIGKRFNFVEYNPVNPNLFVSSDDGGGIHLYDVRSCFGKSWDDTHVLKYTTSLTRGTRKAHSIDIPSSIWSAEVSFL